jgi:hypothetical protein
MPRELTRRNQDEIASAKSSANKLDDDLNAVKAALDPRSERDVI